MRQHRQKIIVGCLWLLIIISFWLYTQGDDVHPIDTFGNILESVRSSVWGPLVLLSFYAVRPLLLVPVTLLTIASGFLFGPLWGAFYAFLATLASSSIAYAIGRAFGKSMLPAADLAPGFLKSLRERSFETIIVCCFLFIPGDIVNYASGFLRIRYLMFVAGIGLGGLPGLFIGVLAGAAIEGDFQARSLSINGWYLLASGFILALSLLASYVIRRRRVTLNARSEVLE